MAVPFCFEDEDEDEDDVLSVPIMIQATARVRGIPSRSGYGWIRLRDHLLAFLIATLKRIPLPDLLNRQDRDGSV